MPGFPNMQDNGFQYGFPAAMENAMDMALNVLAQNAQNIQQQVDTMPAAEDNQRQSEYEPMINKKRKMSNAREALVQEPETYTAPQFKKAQSEGNLIFPLIY